VLVLYVVIQCRIKVGAIDAAALGLLLKIDPAENSKIFVEAEHLLFP